MISQFFKNLSNGIDMSLAWVFSINEDIIEINNNKNVSLFGKDLVNVILKAGQYIEKPKKHYVVLKVAVSSAKSYFPFNAFFNPHIMLTTYEVGLGKLFGLTKSI